jgi:hypothetical protein
MHDDKDGKDEKDDKDGGDEQREMDGSATGHMHNDK